MSRDILTRPPPPGGERLAYGPLEPQFGRLRLPGCNGPWPLVLNVHGGFWRARYDLSHAEHLCASLAGVGVATWNLEYRRVGDDGGGWPGTFQDVATGTDYIAVLLDRLSLDPNRILYLGHSAGGHLALWLASRMAGGRPGPRAVVALAPVADLREAWWRRLGDGAVDALLGCAPKRCGERYADASPAELLPLGVPQMLFHGARDVTVPLDMSHAYVDRATAAGDEASLTVFPDAGHFELIDPLTAEWEVIQERILALLG